MATKNITIRKTKSSISLRGHQLPLYEIAGKNPLLPPGIIPVFDPGKMTAKKIFAIKTAELPGFKTPGFPAVARSITSMLDQFIDRYTPLYGTSPVTVQGKFYLVESAISYTAPDLWILEGTNSFSNETFSFTFIDRHDQWYFLKFNLSYANCILTIKVGETSVKLELGGAGSNNDVFGIFVKTRPSAVSEVVELTIDRHDPVNKIYRLGISSIELYRTARVPTPGSNY